MNKFSNKYADYRDMSGFLIFTLRKALGRFDKGPTRKYNLI
jgi:hypothetical protein